MNTVQVLRRLNKSTKAEVFIVGGFVRDYLRKKNNTDLDVVVRGMSIKELAVFLRRYGKVKHVTLSPTSDTFSVNILLFRASSGDYEAQIALPRRRDRRRKKTISGAHNTLKQDAKTRDFRLNCLYLPIDYKSYKDIVDPVGGREDIRARRIVANGNPNHRLQESPIRMLRAISLASRTGYAIDDELLKAIKANASLITRVPAEAIQAELNTILMSQKPSRYLRLLQRTGLLAYFAPEVENCVGVQQDKRYHKFDVFTHLIYSVDNCDPDLEIRLAALLHDVGKPPTRREVPNGDGFRVTFHKHEIVSVKKARDFMTRLRYDHARAKRVVELVRLHMYHYTREWTDATVRRWIRNAHIPEKFLTEDKIASLPLFRLRAGERLGSGLKSIAVTDRQKDFEQRLIDVYRASKGLEIKDLKVNGDKLMEVFRLQPGKQIGDILKHLLDKVLEHPELNSELELLKLATEYIHAELQKP
jgi:tRNA nucleotidyltransferase (CCA-adding enzyme)